MKVVSTIAIFVYHDEEGANYRVTSTYISNRQSVHQILYEALEARSQVSMDTLIV